MPADTWCTLCGLPENARPAAWWEVRALGPDRRVHESCFLEALVEIQDLSDDELLARVEQYERENRIQR